MYLYYLYSIHCVYSAPSVSHEAEGPETSIRDIVEYQIQLTDLLNSAILFLYTHDHTSATKRGGGREGVQALLVTYGIL